jgi:hypothetical protein
MHQPHRGGSPRRSCRQRPILTPTSATRNLPLVRSDPQASAKKGTISGQRIGRRERWLCASVAASARLRVKELAAAHPGKDTRRARETTSMDSARQCQLHGRRRNLKPPRPRRRTSETTLKTWNWSSDLTSKNQNASVEKASIPGSLVLLLGDWFGLVSKGWKHN